nr:MAG TPA: Electron transfer flavoprotein, alpha subunit [Caudoviricetes sp.]
MRGNLLILHVAQLCHFAALHAVIRAVVIGQNQRRVRQIKFRHGLTFQQYGNHIARRSGSGYGIACGLGLARHRAAVGIGSHFCACGNRAACFHQRNADALHRHCVTRFGIARRYTQHRRGGFGLFAIKADKAVRHNRRSGLRGGYQHDFFSWSHRKPHFLQIGFSGGSLAAPIIWQTRLCRRYRAQWLHQNRQGSGSLKVAEQASKINGVSKVLLAEAPHFAELLAEEIAPLVVSLAAPYRYFVAAASAFGKNIMPRIAVMLDCSQISDLTEIVDKQTFIRPTYAGNVFTTVFSNEEKLVLTIRASAFDAATYGEQAAEIENVAATPAQQLSRFVSRELTQSDRPELTQAKVIVAGGRALGSAEQFDAVLTPLADVLGAAIGASRAAVDAEYVPNDYQVGQTGKIVAPELYFAIGISGAIQHVAGMQDSKVVVAINKDPDAQIFNVADFGIVGDLFEVVPQLTEALKNR